MPRLIDSLVRRVRSMAASPRARDPLLLALGVAVGLATGLLAVLLIAAIRAVRALTFGAVATPLEVVVVPTAGAFLVGVLVWRWLPEAAGSGVSQLMLAIALHAGRVRSAVPGGKLAATAVAIGTGAAGGREGPIVQIGGSMASAVGRVFALDDEQMRALIAAGAGAGIAASFNAPIGGMLFALEVILGGLRLRYLQVLVVACVVASVTAREIIGPALIYNPPPYELGAPAELLVYALVGAAAVAVGLALARGEQLVSDAAGRSRLWPPLRTAAGGLGLGLLALLVPEVLGTGDDLPPVPGVIRDPIAGMLDGGFGEGLGASGFLLLLLAAKLVATALTLGTGNSAGAFGPAIFLGAALGGAIGHAADALVPALDVAPGGVALAGMAAVVGASARTPLTGILIVFELTGDYGLVLPLMLSAGIATFVADRVSPASLYTAPLLRRGVVYAEPEDVDIMQTVRVGEVMTRTPDTVPDTLPVGELRQAFGRSGHHGFPVVDGDGGLVGVVTVADLAREGETAGEVCSRPPVTVTPDDPVFRALRRMAAIDVGRLPVVAVDDRSRLVGLLRRADVVKAYQRAVTRSLGAQQRQARARLRDIGGARFVELVVDERAPAAGCAVRDVAWPQRTIVTSIRRGGDLIMPHGDTTVLPGDEVVVLTDTGAAEECRRLLAGDPAVA